MVVDVRAVGMCADDISVAPFRKPRGELTADAVCFLRCDLSGLEALAGMVRDHVKVTAKGTGIAYIYAKSWNGVFAKCKIVVR
jgi:hypothetical protein